MSGYTPIFSTVFDGTLHGKWPQTGVWLALLAMADRNGCVDRSPRAIASDIGIDVPALLECIAEFCAPDPMSRTRENDGRRLELIDPDRPWGWRVVNHGKYREKARLAAKNSEAVAVGKDAERKRQAREMSAGVRRCPPQTAGDRLSDSDSDADYGEQLRSSSERSFRPSSSERARQDGTISKKEFRRRQFSAEVASLAKQKAMP